MISPSDLKQKVRDDPEFLQRLSAHPDDAVKEVTEPVYFRDLWIYRGVVAVLGATVLIALLGGIFLQVSGVQIPESLVALGAAAVGALAGLLAPSPAK